MARKPQLPGWKWDAATKRGVLRVKVKDAHGEWRLVQRSIRARDAREAETKALEERAAILRDPPRPRREGGSGAKRRGSTLEVMAAHDIIEHRRRGVTDRHAVAIESKWNVILTVADPSTHVEDIDYDWLREYEGTRRAGEKDARGRWIRKPVRGQTIVREFQRIRSALKIAKRRGKLAEVPEEWPRVRRDVKDDARAGKLRPPELLAAWIRYLDGDARDEVELDLLTGLRGGGELKRLDPGWIEPAPPESGVPALIRVPASASKTRTERVVGCPQRALEIIQRRIPAAEKRAREDGGPCLIFTTSDHKKHRLGAWRRACKEMGVDPDPPATLRDLRHTYATLALQQSSDPAAVMAALGHRDLSTTQLYLSSPVERTVRLGSDVERLLPARGESADVPRGGGKLTRSQIAEARRLRDSGETLVQIAARYGVHFTTIGKALQRAKYDENGMTEKNGQTRRDKGGKHQ